MVGVSKLAKIAVYGAVINASAGAFFYYMMQSRLASGEFYSRPVEALRADERVSRALGPPIRTLFLKLSNKDNFVNENKSQLSIPVKGAKYKGHLHSRCTRIEGTKHWNIESLILEVNEKTVPVTFSNKTDAEELIS